MNQKIVKTLYAHEAAREIVELLKDSLIIISAFGVKDTVDLSRISPESRKALYTLWIREVRECIGRILKLE